MKWRYWLWVPGAPAASPWQLIGEVIHGVDGATRNATFRGLLRENPGGAIYALGLGDGRVEKLMLAGSSSLIRIG